MAKVRKRNNVNKNDYYKSHFSLWVITLLLISGFIWGLLYIVKNFQYKKHTSEIKVERLLRNEIAKAVKSNTKTITNSNQYELKLDKIKDFATVDHLKAELNLLGIEPNVAKVTDNNSSYYVITLGPFKNKKKMELVKQRLHENKIKSTVYVHSG